MVATDVAARGIDVAEISHVINYDMPDTVDSYTHRIGRTGRAEQTGEAYTFTTRGDEAMIRSIERTLGQRIERRRLDGFDYDASQDAPSAGERPGQRQRSYHGGGRQNPGRSSNDRSAGRSQGGRRDNDARGRRASDGARQNARRQSAA